MHVATRRTLLSRPAVAPSFTDPTDLASLVAWYDFSDATTLFTDAGTTPVSSDGDLIYQANDKSGNNNHVVQATDTKRPAYKIGIQNSKSVSRYDGGDWLQDTFTLIQPETVFVVFNSASQGANEWIIDGKNTQGMEIRANAVPTAIHIYAGGVGTAGVSANITGAWMTAGCIFNTPTATIYVNGGAANTDTDLGTANGGGITIGAAANGSTPLTSDIAEVIVCNAALSVADLNSLGEYLADKWGLTWTTVT